VTEPAGGIQHLPRFFVKQRLTMMVNRYEVRTVNPDGAPGELLAIAQQKRLAMKERVTFFADEARTTPVFSFAARNILELAAVYDVFDAAGTAIGYFQKDFAGATSSSRSCGASSTSRSRSTSISSTRRTGSWSCRAIASSRFATATRSRFRTPASTSASLLRWRWDSTRCLRGDAVRWNVAFATPIRLPSANISI
jgi:hypothetical protein